jgi:hypothetical protein
MTALSESAKENVTANVRTGFVEQWSVKARLL